MKREHKTHWRAADKIQCGRDEKNCRFTSDDIVRVDCVRCLRLAFENALPMTVWAHQNSVTYTSIGIRLDQVSHDRRMVGS